MPSPKWETHVAVTDPAVAARCPFQDAYYFSYRDAVHEMCQQPLSYAKPCVGATNYQLHFKHCQPTASLHAKGSLLSFCFSQTWLRYVWLIPCQIRPSVCLSVTWCTLLRGINFSGMFLHHIVAWPSCNSPTKISNEDRPRGSPHPRGLNRKGVVKQANLAYRRQYLVTYLLYSYLHTAG